jgi:hypothetical protein
MLNIKLKINKFLYNIIFNMNIFQDNKIKTINYYLNNFYKHKDKKYIEICLLKLLNNYTIDLLYNIFQYIYSIKNSIKRGKILFNYMSRFCNKQTDKYITIKNSLIDVETEQDILLVLYNLYKYISLKKYFIECKKYLNPIFSIKNELSLIQKEIKIKKTINKEYKDILINFLYNECPDIKKIDFNKKEKYVLVLGDIQSGKTNFTICGLYLCLLHNIPCVYIIKGEKSQYIQFKNHLERFNKKIEKYLLKKKFVYEHIVLSYVGDNKIFNKKETINILSGNKKGIIISLCNYSQLSKLYNITNEIKYNWKYYLFVDEADETCYHNLNSNVRIYFDLLKYISTKVYGITATGYEQLLCENDLNKKSLILLSKKDLYKGPLNINYNILPFKIYNYNSKELIKNIRDKDKNLQYYLEHIKNLKPYFLDKYNEYHPIISLHKTSTLTKHHLNLLLYIKKYYTKDFAIIVYNGYGIRLYHHTLKNKIKIQNKIYKQCSTIKNTFILSNLNIQDILQFLYNNGGSYIFSHIIIISGDLADRGINFISKNFKWHLTHEYLLCNSNRQNLVPYLIQSLRLCGIYSDNIPLYLYTTEKIKENIINGYLFQIDKIKQLILSNDNNKDSVKNLIQFFPTTKDKIGNAKFSMNNYKLNIVDYQDDGISIDELNNIKSNIVINCHDKNNDILTYKRNKQDNNTEFLRLSNEMFPKWSAKNNKTKISNFMKNINPTYKYSIDEFKLLTDKYKIQISQLLYYQKFSKNNIDNLKTHGFGKLFKLHNNKYYLYPELINSFNIHFNK